MPTPLQLHFEKWKKGCGSEICKTALNVCLGRGQAPCDILFVGEAGGASEDSMGTVFIGPAGKLFDRIIKRVIPEQYKVGFTNLVGCMPKDETGGKMGEPDDDSVIKCQPRLREFVWLCDPKLIVCVGKLSAGWLETGYLHHCKLHTICPTCKSRQFRYAAGMMCKNNHTGQGIQIPRVEVDHPAFILRNEYSNQGLLIQRCQAIIREAIEEHLETPSSGG